MPLRNLNIIGFCAAFSMACYLAAPGSHYARKIARTIELIDRHYVEPVEHRRLFEDAMKGMVSGLDQHSSFIPPKSFQQVEEALDQEFGGIGIMVEIGRESERLTVLTPLINTPAYEAGLRAGDTILEIDGVTTRRMTLETSVEMMRGKPGEPVALKILHAGSKEPLDIELKRAIIPIESVLGDTRREDGNWNFYLEENPRIGYVRLTTFGKNSADELLKTMQGTASTRDNTNVYPYGALILDLRDNAGGLLESAVRICDMFLDEGVIVTTRGRGGALKSRFSASSGTSIPSDIPLVVMINRFSASASEIVAACLQDHNRAVIIGERSWGKGTVQNIIELESGENPSVLKLTTATYWRPSGQNIHRRRDAKDEDAWGVQPTADFLIKLTDEQMIKLNRRRRDRDIIRDPESGQPISPPKEQAPKEKAPKEKAPKEKAPQEKAPQEKAPQQKDRKEPSKKSTSDKSTGSEKSADDPEAKDEDFRDFDDPQLRRAIDYLERQLKLLDRQPRAA